MRPLNRRTTFGAPALAAGAPFCVQGVLTILRCLYYASKHGKQEGGFGGGAGDAIQAQDQARGTPAGDPALPAGVRGRADRAEDAVPQMRRGGVMPVKVKIIGMRFGRLVALTQGPSGGKSLFRCDCGAEKEIDGHSVRRGRILSCGCHRQELRTTCNGESARESAKCSPEYRAWRGMLNRCYNSNDADKFKNYGGRGITVCERWRASFVDFVGDMGRRPSALHTVGRKNNDGPYAPDNCEWQTPIQQGRNRRDNHFVSAFGKTLPISEWAELTGLSHGRILKRLLRGWSQEQAVSK
jgi:hypothetical protein